MTTFSIWRVTYGTYADVVRYGDIKPVLLRSRGLSFEEARLVVNALGFGHCMKPDEALR